MYVVQKTQDSGATWPVASLHTEIGDAQGQMALYIANGVAVNALKIGVQAADGTITDYTP